MAHVVQERLFQLGTLRQTARLYQFLFMVFDVLDVLQQSRNDVFAARHGGGQRAVTQFPPFVAPAGEVEAVLPFMGMHVLRGTVAAVETLAVVGMQEVYYLVQRDALARVADKVVEVRVADNPLAFQAPHVGGAAADGKRQRFVLVAQGVLRLTLAPALHGEAADKKGDEQQQEKPRKDGYI